MRSFPIRSALLASGSAIVLASTSAAADDLREVRQEIQDMEKRIVRLQADRAIRARRVAAAVAVETGDRPKSWKIPGTNTSIRVGGYIKLDLIWSLNSKGTQAFGGASLLGGAFAIGLGLGVNDGTNGGDFSLHARQSRIFIVTTTPTDWGTLSTRLEGDFFGTGGNAPLFRLRHAWGCLGPVCAGQTWSTWMPVWAGAETLDFGGAISAIFVRHAQIRFTHSFGGGWVVQLAIEDPNGGAAFGSGGGDALVLAGAAPAAIPASQRWPDFVAAVYYNFKYGRLWVGGLLRQAELDAGILGVDDSAINWGVQVAGAFKITKRLRAGFAAHVGKGFQGYLGNAVPGNYIVLSVLPLAFPVTFTVAPVFGWGAYVWIRRAWTDTLRSTVMYSHYQNNSHDAIGSISGFSSKFLVFPGTIHWARSVHLNLIWSPVPAVNIGIEYIYGFASFYSGFIGVGNGAYHAIQIAFQYKW